MYNQPQEVPGNPAAVLSYNGIQSLNHKSLLPNS